jgi:N-sulfoglucosamine sulfohydrolase
LIGFIDFGPTVLSLADVKVPEPMQGQPFLGSQKASPRQYLFAARDRMDEAYDVIRAVRDTRYKYFRNFMPHLTYGQDIDYMNEMPTMQEMRRLHAEGKLVGPQKHYFLETKPIEELYDTRNDPHEIHNLAAVPQFKDVLERMRNVLLDWMKESGDVGLIPEPEFEEMKRPRGIWQRTAAPTVTAAPDTRSKKVKVTITCATPGSSIAYRIDGANGRWKLYSTPLRLDEEEVIRAKACRIGFRDSEEVTFKAVEGTAALQQVLPQEKALPHWREKLDRTDLLERLREIKALDGGRADAIPKYLESLNDPDGSVRYWAAVGLHTVCIHSRTIEPAASVLKEHLDDVSPIVRIASAEALCDWGHEKEALPVLIQAMQDKSDTVRLNAVISLGRIGEKARPALPQLQAATKDSFGYVTRVVKHVLQRLKAEG